MFGSFIGVILGLSAVGKYLNCVSNAFEITQVSFDDPADGDVDARDAKINEGGENGTYCFIYTSEAIHNDTSMSFDDWKIWETCNVFEDGNVTNTLIAGDKDGNSTEYKFADTSGDGKKTCFLEDLSETGGVSVHLLTRPSGTITELTDSEATDRKGNSNRCDISRDGSTVTFDTDDVTLGNDGLLDGQDHVYLTNDEGASFHRLVPDEYFENSTANEAKWGVASGDGSFAAFHAFIKYEDASSSGWETYLWRESDQMISKVSKLNGKECNRTLMFEKMVDMWGLANVTSEGLESEDDLGNAQSLCSGFAAMGELVGGAGTIDVKDNPASISDDGRFLTFMTSFDSATMEGTYEDFSPVSVRNLFLYDALLGITWAITNEGPDALSKIEEYCCPSASSTTQRDTCSAKNTYRLSCCWQKPCYAPVVTNRISGDGNSIVYSTDRFPDVSQIKTDWEIVHHHIPTDTKTIITNTNDKNYDDFYPSISSKGDAMAWTSDFDYTTNSSITTTNQIFATKLDMGCSKTSSASNYHPSPEMEVCCEFSDIIDPIDYESPDLVSVALTFNGDPDEMKSNVAFYDASSVEAKHLNDESWCTTYKKQVLNDFACSFAIPLAYVTVRTADCNIWEKDSIEITLELTGNTIKSTEEIRNELVEQYDDTDSALWKSYLTKTMNGEPIEPEIVTNFVVSIFPFPVPSPLLQILLFPLRAIRNFLSFLFGLFGLV